MDSTAAAVDDGEGAIRYRLPQKAHEERVQPHWLPAQGPVRVGLTAGASTPNQPLQLTASRTRSGLFEDHWQCARRQLNGKPLGCHATIRAIIGITCLWLD